MVIFCVLGKKKGDHDHQSSVFFLRGVLLSFAECGGFFHVFVGF